jgi:hypothetical protein
MKELDPVHIVWARRRTALRGASAFPRVTITRLRTSGEQVDMTDNISLLAGEYSYSTRACRRCNLPMTAREELGGRVWECSSCGRKAR